MSRKKLSGQVIDNKIGEKRQLLHFTLLYKNKENREKKENLAKDDYVKEFLFILQLKEVPLFCFIYIYIFLVFGEQTIFFKDDVEKEAFCCRFCKV